jgi:hypothetical protein
VGELYDAFDLVKQENGINKFIERKDEAGDERRFSNTIPYEDPLPENLQTKLHTKYPDNEITRVSASKNKEGVLIFNVRLEKDGERTNVSIDAKGNILD